MTRASLIKWKQLRIIIISWMFMGFLISVHDYLLLSTADSLGLAAHYSFWISVGRNVGAGLLGGLLGGSLLAFHLF